MSYEERTEDRTVTYTVDTAVIRYIARDAIPFHVVDFYTAWDASSTAEKIVSCYLDQWESIVQHLPEMLGGSLATLPIMRTNMSLIRRRHKISPFEIKLPKPINIEVVEYTYTSRPASVNRRIKRFIGWGEQ